MIRVPSIGIGPTTVSTVCLYLLYLRLFPPRSTSNFYQKYKVLLRNASELAIRHGITHRILRILNFTQRTQWANPRALILNIEGAMDHSCLINCSGAKYKVFTLTFLIFNGIIFRFDSFQPHHPPVISVTRILVSMN